MKATILLVVFGLSLIISTVNSARHFHHGRMKGGNLGVPFDVQNLSIEKEVEPRTQELYFVQKLDHSNPSNPANWRQRYFVNEEFYKDSKKGPVFLFIGGEGPASAYWMSAGSWIDDAKKHNALLFQLEHRYYGKSHPTPDLSVPNLRYLSSEQALADLAAFIAAKNAEYKLDPDAKWIAFGGSYSGSLAAWLRAKYPHLVHGAMSASGPILAKVDFSDYMKVVAASLATHSDACVAAVKSGVAQIGVLLKQADGPANLTRIFKLCEPIQQSLNNPDDLASFYESIADNFAGMVQYNQDNLGGARANIQTVCNIMVNESLGAAVNRLGAVNNLILSTETLTCLDYRYSNGIKQIKEVGWESEAAVDGGRQWVYQTCTEFGYYQTSSTESELFGAHFNVSFFTKQCKDIYGDVFDSELVNQAINNTNINFGGLNIAVSNVVYVHGSIDPWHALGIVKTVDKRAPAIYINGTAHCANMYPPSAKDLPSLVQARLEVSNLISSWLTQNNNDCYSV